MSEYIELQFEQLDGQTRARLKETSLGQPAGDFHAPFSPAEAAKRLEKALTRGTWVETQRAMGEELYLSLAAGVGVALSIAVNQTRRKGVRGILQMSFAEDTTALAGLPWELLHDGRRHLMASGAVDLSRCVSYPESLVPVKAEAPLRVLHICASPKDLPSLDQDSTGSLLSKVPGLVIESLPNAKYNDLLQRLENPPHPHVLHFNGHGGFLDGEAILAFEKANGEPDLVAYQALSNALVNRVSLVMLNACQPTRLRHEMSTLFEALAPALIQAGVPAVIGMQFPIMDKSVTDFLGAFYRLLARGEPLIRAMANARRWLYGHGQWYVPALYLRGDDPSGHIFPRGWVPAMEVPELRKQQASPPWLDVPTSGTRAQLEEQIGEITRLIKESEDVILLSENPDEIQAFKRKKFFLLRQYEATQVEFAELSTPVGEEILKAELKPIPSIFSLDSLSQLPYPIAVKCAAFNAAHDDATRFQTMDEILCNTVKTLAAVCLAYYRHDEPTLPQLRPWMRRFSRRQLSEWLTLIMDIVNLYSGETLTRPQVIVSLSNCLTRHLPDESPIAHACRELASQLDIQSPNEPATVRRFLELLVFYRECTWASGVLHLAPEFIQVWLPLLVPALLQALVEMDFLRHYPLRYSAHVDQRFDGWVYQMIEWLGPNDRPAFCPTQVFSGRVGAPPFKPRRLHLCAQDGTPLFNLHPFMVHTKDSARREQLCFLEVSGENETLVFRPCHSGTNLEIPEGLHASLRAIYDPSISQERTVQALEALENRLDRMNTLELPPTQSEAPPLDELLSRLDETTQETLDVALGEAQRIGHFWLGTEFLLMALSRENNILSETLENIHLDPGYLRGMLRGLVGVRRKDWRRQRNLRTIGAAFFSELREVDPTELVEIYGTEQMPDAVVTPRMLSVLQEAISQTDGKPVTTDHLLLALLKHPQCVAVNFLLGQIAEADHDPNKMIASLAQRLGLKPPGATQPRPPVSPPGDEPVPATGELSPEERDKRPDKYS